MDELVVPELPITDYNTQYSGITAAMMQGATLSLQQARAALLRHLGPRTILVPPPPPTTHTTHIQLSSWPCAQCGNGSQIGIMRIDASLASLTALVMTSLLEPPGYTWRTSPISCPKAALHLPVQRQRYCRGAGPAHSAAPVARGVNNVVGRAGGARPGERSGGAAAGAHPCHRHRPPVPAPQGAPLRRPAAEALEVPLQLLQPALWRIAEETRTCGGTCLESAGVDRIFKDVFQTSHDVFHNPDMIS